MKRGDTDNGPCYRHICSGTMYLEDDVCFVCDTCGMSVAKELYLEYLNGNVDLEDGDDFEDVPDYDPVYDEEGQDVPCPDCMTPLKYHDEQYTCPRCDIVMTREEFFSYIGAEPLGEKCMSCNENYAYCKEYCELYSEF